MTARCLAAVGLQWGDEGKGKIIDWLAAKAQHVARFQGGHNAGHTVICNGHKHVLHLVPSGIIQPKCKCYIGPGVVLSLTCLLDELATLSTSIPDFAGRVALSADCTLIMPHHMMLDEASEGPNSKIGTTRRGIGPAHEDKVGRRAVRLRDVLDGEFASRLHSSVAHANCLLKHLHKTDLADEQAIAKQLIAEAEQVRPYIGDIAHMLDTARVADHVILVEASQGALLDVEHGSYPFVTSASCLATASASGLGVDLKPHVIGISKGYVTRVGNGAFPTEISDNQAQLLITQGEEYGATTSRQRRVGWLDIPALRYALRLSGCKHIVLTKLDVLGLLDPIRICTSYENNGRNVNTWVPDNRVLSGYTPRYMELPGWGKLGKIATYTDLPPNCRDFISTVEQLCDARISAVSYGADRNDTLLLQDPFQPAA